MKKIAFIFPGQGAQVSQMGKEIMESDPDSKKVFERANSIVDFDMEEICFFENPKLHETAYTQPIVLATSIAILKAVEKIGIQPDIVAGLSLGEYTALVANGAITLEEAIRLVRNRGLYMEEAATLHKGTMVAVIGSNEESIHKVCEKVTGYVTIANINSRKQVVITGDVQAIENASKVLEEQGAKVISLQVSGAFHSEHMEPAKEKLKKEINKLTFHDFTIPYVTNVTGKIVKSGPNNKKNIGNLLAQQITSPVRWLDCVETMIEDGVEVFVEIGSSGVLKGLMKKIDCKKPVFSIYDLDSLQVCKAFVEGSEM